MTRHFTLMDFNTWWISIPDGSGIFPVFLFQYLAVSSSIQVFQMKPILKALINTSVRVNLTASQRNTGVCEIDGCFSICLRKIKNVWFSGVWWNSPPSPPVPFKCPINSASFFRRWKIWQTPHSKTGNRRMVLERRRKDRPLPEFNISIPTFAKVEKKIHKHIWVWVDFFFLHISLINSQNKRRAVASGCKPVSFTSASVVCRKSMSSRPGRDLRYGETVESFHYNDIQQVII